MQSGSKLTLGDFVKQIAADIKEMPFKAERPWHVLFYELQHQPDEPGKPEFLRNLRFDWDGPYPKCRDLSDFIHALHWNSSVSATNPSFEKIVLPDEVAKLWSGYRLTIDPDGQRYLDKAIKTARDILKCPEVIQVA
jgi:hypothetical protein